jgi:hypothetical protein
MGGILPILVVSLFLFLFIKYIVIPMLKVVFLFFLLLLGISPFIFFIALGFKLKDIWEYFNNRRNLRRKRLNF